MDPDIVLRERSPAQKDGSCTSPLTGGPAGVAVIHTEGRRVGGGGVRGLMRTVSVSEDGPW